MEKKIVKTGIVISSKPTKILVTTGLYSKDDYWIETNKQHAVGSRVILVYDKKNYVWTIAE